MTPETLAAAYEFVRTTKPFRSWGLPPAADVVFRVTKSSNDFGEMLTPGPDGKFMVRLSTVCNHHTSTLITTMAHEMVHMRQYALFGKLDHGKVFQRLAKQVCKHHGFDPGAF